MAVAEKIDDVVDSVKEAPLTDKVSSIAHDAVDSAAEKVGSAEESIRSTASETADTIAEKKESASAEIATVADQARLLVVKNPLTAASAAFAAGLLVTSIMSKRS
ncbi:MAG: hypothetical protein DHS20C12_00800 [Pseudohongiella sp.]|nr:MAG: hypothetical protein DHS20C12_00800 [Pseudohongiella sp.]